MKEGKGVYEYIDGLKCEGTWVKDKLNGALLKTTLDGEEWEE